MKHLIKFEELKVEQEVWTIKSGYCKIKSLLDKPEYPILTDDGITYTKLGMVASGNKHPSLFLSNPFESEERVVEVRDGDKHKWERRVFIKKSYSVFLTWRSAETIEQAAATIETEAWYQMRELPTKTVLTKQQIADKFGVEVENLEIEL